MGIDKDLPPGVLDLDPNVEDGYDFDLDERYRKRMKVLFFINIIFPPLFIYIYKTYSKTKDPICHKWFKWAQNVFAFEMCALIVVCVTLFSWWFKDALAVDGGDDTVESSDS